MSDNGTSLLVGIAGAVGGVWLLSKVMSAGFDAGRASVPKPTTGSTPATVQTAPSTPSAPVDLSDLLARVRSGAVRWVSPVPSWSGRAPVISQEFRAGGPKPHPGVDIMYRRRSRDELADRFPSGSIHGSPNHFMPDGVPALAMADGVLRYAGHEGVGGTVIIDHSGGVTSRMTHLSALLVDRVRHGAFGPRVLAGQPMGWIGGSPKDGRHLMHLHLELYPAFDRARVFDPRPWLLGRPVLPHPFLATEVASALQAPRAFA